ncbi:hypothetical protein NW757_014087 [Fusarium falciforme]|nr:hypothetical protein NW757_014087 [Fusarium falciforme]
MALKGLFQGAFMGVPEPYPPIARSRRNQLPIGREGNGQDVTAVVLECLFVACSKVPVLERLLQGAFMGVPEPYPPIARSRRNQIPIGREGNGQDVTAVVLECLFVACSKVPVLERLLQGAFMGVPEPYPPIARSRRKPPTVGREDDSINRSTTTFGRLIILT